MIQIILRNFNLAIFLGSLHLVTKISIVFNYLVVVFNVNFPFVYSKFLVNKLFNQNEIHEEIQT